MLNACSRRALWAQETTGTSTPSSPTLAWRSSMRQIRVPRIQLHSQPVHVKWGQIYLPALTHRGGQEKIGQPKINLSPFHHFVPISRSSLLSHS
jgi:hypothetical protein